MNKIITLSIPVLLPLFLSGCTSPRWQVHQAAYSFHSKEYTDEYSTKNTLLLDTQTGKTWIMTACDTNEPGDYYWVEMKR